MEAIPVPAPVATKPRSTDRVMAVRDSLLVWGRLTPRSQKERRSSGWGRDDLESKVPRTQ